MKVNKIKPFGVRMQPELKRKVEESAQLNGRSINAEINFQLTRLYFPDRFKKEEAA